MAYPNWIYYPTQATPPPWVAEFIAVVQTCRISIESSDVSGLNSNGTLAQLRPGLEELGYKVEKGGKQADRVERPVLFGDQGSPRVTYRVDAIHEDQGVLVEIEAGRALMGNAIYRDLIRASLIVDARYLVLGVMNEYWYSSKGTRIVDRSYEESHKLLDALYASGRLGLPFEGILLFGY